MPRRVIVCANCGAEAEQQGRGLCSPCYHYQRARGVPRPAWLYAPRQYPRLCQNCAREVPPGQIGHDRCSACRQWWRRYGTERPLDAASRRALGIAYPAFQRHAAPPGWWQARSAG
jgi:hypothetical protein